MMTVATKKLAVQTAFAAFVFMTLLFFVLLPKVGVVRKLSAEVRAALAENQKLQSSVLTAKHSGVRLDEIQETLAQYKTKALDQEDLTRALDEIGAAAQEAQLTVVSLRALDELRRIPGEPLTEGAFEIQQVKIALKAEGQYPNMVQYFKLLEKLPYRTDVQIVSLKSASFGLAAEGEDPNLSVEVMLAVLMRMPPMKKQP